MKILSILLLLTNLALADEATTKAPEAKGSTPEVSTVDVNATPKKVCETLVKAAVEDNFKAFAENTAMPEMMGHNCGKGDSCPMGHHGKKECTKKNCPMSKDGKHQAMKKGAKGMEHGMGMMPMEDRFHKMHAKEMENLKSMNCKEEKVAGDHAWVEATGKNETRLVPFKKNKDKGYWQLDLKTYFSFYHPEMGEYKSETK